MNNVFIKNHSYTLPTGHNPLPCGIRGRAVALKWLLTGKRPSLDGYVSKPVNMVISCVGGGGSTSMSSQNQTK